jgi:uncharacterized protein YjdB
MRVAAPMVNIRALCRATATAVVFGGLTGCLDLKAIPDACTISVAPATLAIPVNSTSAIVGTAFDCNGNSIRNKRISFSSSNTAVATVTTEGNVIAVSVGGATISAVANGKSASVAVTVTPETAATVTINPNTVTLRKSNVRQLTATARNGQNQVISGRTFRWSSSNSAVAAVDQSGQVIALAPGQVVVTAETDRTVGSAAIVVTEIPLGSCALAPTSSKVTVTQSVQPTLTLRDTANNIIPTQGRPIVWTSSNEVVAAVSPTGLATTRRAGMATISASPVENSQVSCSTTIEAVDARITQVVITPRSGALRLGIPRVFSVTLLDSTTNQIPAGRIVTWATNTPTVVQVSQAGIVTGRSLGTARIIASSEGVADTVTLAVTKIPVGLISVTPIQATLLEGQTRQLSATVQDSTGEVVTDRPLEWISTDPNRATVTPTGLVTGVSAGVATISATTEQRVGQASVSVQQVPVDSISVSPTVTLVRGLTGALEITLRDASRNILRNRFVVVTSTAPSLVTGTVNALATQLSISAISTGQAILSLQAVNSLGQSEGRVSRVTVNVIPPTSEATVDTIIAPTTFSVERGRTSTFDIRVLGVGGSQLFNRSVVVTSTVPSIATGVANLQGTSVTVSGIATGEVFLTLSVVNNAGQIEGKASRVRIEVTPPPSVTPVDTIIVPTTFTLRAGTQSAFEMRLLDAAGNRLFARRVFVTSNFPGIVIGVPDAQSTLIQVGGATVGEAILTVQAVDDQDRNQGRTSSVRVTVTAPAAGVVRKQAP